MQKIILTYLFLLLIVTNSRGQQIVLEGIYTGKKIYVKNSGINGQGNCTDKVLINGKEVPFKNETVFQITPDSLGFKIGDSLKIIILHKTDCKPLILNDNSSPKSTFQILSISIDQSGTLNWVAKEKSNKNPFIIQQYINNKWTKIGETESKGDMKENNYSFKISTDIKGFDFRLMQVSELGRNKYSKTVKVSPTK